MDKLAEAGLVVLALLGFVGWLGGGRKWAFRTMLSALILAAVVVAGILLYAYGTDKVAEHRARKIRTCAIAKVAKARCVPGERPPPGAATASHAPVVLDFSKAQPIDQSRWHDYKPSAPKSSAKQGSPEVPKEVIFDVCPAYMLFDDPTPEQEDAAVVAAEQECRQEVDPDQKSLHDQISEYKRDHGINDPFAAIAKPIRALGPAECATRVREAYPGVYNDMDDATLTKKVLAKYPHYCDVTSSPPDFIPDIKGIR